MGKPFDAIPADRRVNQWCTFLKLLLIRHPTLRIGQLVSNIVDQDELAYIEDKDLMARTITYMKQTDTRAIPNISNLTNADRERIRKK